MFAIVSKSLNPSAIKQKISPIKRLTLQKAITARSISKINYPEPTQIYFMTPTTEKLR